MWSRPTVSPIQTSWNAFGIDKRNWGTLKRKKTFHLIVNLERFQRLKKVATWLSTLAQTDVKN